jgi:SAM-dependent methyltransferase
VSTHTLNTNWYRTFFAGASIRLWDGAIPPAATQLEVAALVETLNLKPGMSTLDIACGLGRHAVELARLGHRIVGVDISAESLALARERSAGLPAEYIEADLDVWQPAASFDAAYWLGNGLTYLPPARFRACLVRIHAALKSGARFVAETGCCAESLFSKLEPRAWYEVGAILMTVDNRYHAREGCLETGMRFIEHGQETRAVCLHHVYTAAELIRIFESAGFRLIQLDAGPGTETYTKDSALARFVLEA